MQEHITRSELGRMALTAAINIERTQLRKSADLASVETFLEALEAQIADEDVGITLRDETLFPYYSSALAKADGAEPLSRNQFAYALRSALLRHKSSAPEGDSLEKVKQFCLAFHEAIVRAVQQHTLGKPRADGRIR